ncbi:MAG: hypothetical protein ACRDSJ_04510 [Rubrobacteraceae bacterium]
MTAFACNITLRSKKREVVGEMHGFGFQEELAKEHTGRMLAEAEERRLAREVAGLKAPSLRARIARRLFEAAVATERDAAWNAVWEKMEAPRRS